MQAEASEQMDSTCLSYGLPSSYPCPVAHESSQSRAPERAVCLCSHTMDNLFTYETKLILYPCSIKVRV